MQNLLLSYTCISLLCMLLLTWRMFRARLEWQDFVLIFFAGVLWPGSLTVLAVHEIRAARRRRLMSTLISQRKEAELRGRLSN